MQEPEAPRWYRDMLKAWAGGATIFGIAIAFWHFGGSALFTYDKRIAVVEERSSFEGKIDSIRDKLDGKLESFRMGMDRRIGGVDDTIRRVEGKVDTAAVSAAQAAQKMDTVLARIDQISSGQGARTRSPEIRRGQSAPSDGRTKAAEGTQR